MKLHETKYIHRLQYKCIEIEIGYWQQVTFILYIYIHIYIHIYILQYLSNYTLLDHKMCDGEVDNKYGFTSVTQDICSNGGSKTSDGRQ